MKIKSINYQRTYNIGQYESLKLGVDIELDNEDEVEAFKLAREIIKKQFKESMPNLDAMRGHTEYTLPTIPNEIPNTQVQPEEPPIKEPTLEESIRDATTIEELQAWRLPANANAETAFIYKARMKQLQNQLTK